MAAQNEAEFRTFEKYLHEFEDEVRREEYEERECRKLEAEIGHLKQTRFVDCLETVIRKHERLLAVRSGPGPVRQARGTLVRQFRRRAATEETTAEKHDD